MFNYPQKNNYEKTIVDNILGETRFGFILCEDNAAQEINGLYMS